jgi:hypothetical protein
MRSRASDDRTAGVGKVFALNSGLWEGSVRRAAPQNVEGRKITRRCSPLTPSFYPVGQGIENACRPDFQGKFGQNGRGARAIKLRNGTKKERKQVLVTFVHSWGNK